MSIYTQSYLVKTTILFLFITTNYSAQFVENAANVNIDHLHIEPQIMGGGAAFFDYNNDGFDDLYLTGGSGSDHFYENNGDGTFTEKAATVGFSITASHNTVGVATGDIDNDGFRDVFVTTDKFSANLLFKNNGDGTFTDISVSAGILHQVWSTSVSFGDYNLDGFLDIYVASYCNFPFTAGTPYYETTITGVPNLFYINNGDNTFTEKADLLGVQDNGTALAVTFTDFDNDNDMDIYLGNDFGTDFNPNALFENLYPIDSFARVGLTTNTNASMYTMSTITGDYNEDGLLDYYVSNMMENVMYKNTGNNVYSNESANLNMEATTVTSWGGLFFDYNNDSYLDLFVASGQMMFEEANQYQVNNLFLNSGSNTFTDVALTAGMADSSRSRGAAYSDFDNDGDLDFVLVNVDSSQTATKRTWFMENQGTGLGNYIKIKLRGTTNNRDGFGAHVTVFTNGRSLLKENDGGSGYLSHNSSILHFGLGAETIIDSVIINWPGGGVQVETGININQQIEIIEQATVHQVVCFGDSLFLEGAYQTQAGSYSDTITTMGVDSIYNTVLHFTDSVYFNAITICRGDSTFLEGTYQKVTGTYNDTLTSSLSCDSIIQTTLTVTIFDTTNIMLSICDGDSVLLENDYQKTNGFYTDFYTAVNGCDSMVVTELTINPIYLSSISQEICNGDSTILGGIYQNTAGLYYDTLSSFLGCDSVIETNLIINLVYNVTDTASICSNDSLILGGEYQNLTGDYVDTLSSFFGCDSIVTTHLLINLIYGDTTNLSLCDGDSLIINGVFQTVPGEYSDVYPSQVTGCDSTVLSILEVFPTFSSSESITICERDSALIHGSYEYLDGVYLNSGATQHGCDSLVSINLTVIPPTTINIGTSILWGDSILLEGQYQTQDGIYTDTLSSNFGCDSIVVTTLSVDVSSSIQTHQSHNNNFIIYPNPTKGNITIASIKEINNYEVSIYNLLGVLVYKKSINTNESLNLTSLEKGIYQVMIVSNSKVNLVSLVID